MKNNKGQALVEFIIVLPILLLIIMAIIDLGNIFIKKYSLENHLDIVYEMYKEKKYTNINNYLNNNNINIEYEKKQDFIIINLSKEVNVFTPILNNILGKKYKIVTSKAVYE